MAAWHLDSSPDAVRALAPEAFAALDAMRTAAAAIDVAALAASSPVVAAYAEQCTIDVASLTDEQRATAAATLGDDLFGFVQAVWVADMADRIDHAWQELAGVALERSVPLDASPPPGDAGALWAAIDAFLPAVARLAALDPVTTEVVRLRVARAHDCRLCRSLRSVGAIEAGADEGTFDDIDRFEESDLDDALKVALRVVDAMIWQPRAWPDGLAASVRATFSPAQAIEIVLDVVRNGANKVAVALGADEARVADGVEYFAMDATGVLTYGLDRPTPRADPGSTRSGS